MIKQAQVYACRLIFFLCMLPVSGRGQTETAGVYSIVRDSQVEMICKSATQAVKKESYSVTVLSPKGLAAASFTCVCDMFRSLQKFSGEITDASGRTVRKIKKSDLSKSEYSSDFSSDDYFYYYECNLPSYPFTVHYEWEIKYSDNLIGYPAFWPQTDYNQPVEKAGYRLELPAGQNCRYREINTAGAGIRITKNTAPDGKLVIEASAGPMPAVVPEPFGPPVRDLYPYVLFVPDRFVFSRTEGNLDSWLNFGKWQYGLLDGRDELPETFKSRLLQLTAACKTDREKVKAVYDYLAENTRYVSIQLGIGGLQPIPAAQVCRTGFGDCKGLSNLARAMLKALGIASNYTVISTENERLLSDFASANQMNHAILQVPLPNDTLWLECTNAWLPFGYVHDRIAGHDALVIEPAGGRLYRLPAYPDSSHSRSNRATVQLSATGGAEVEAEENSRLSRYEDRFGFGRVPPDKQKDVLRATIDLPQARLENIRIHEKKEAAPEITIRYTVKSDQYGHKTGNRLFLPVNIFRKGFQTPPPAPRKYPVVVGSGYLDTDSICLVLPEGFTVEGLPKPVRVEGPFGTFESSVETQGRNIHIVQRLFMRRGSYPPEVYPAFLAFRKQIAGQYNGKIILKKE